MIFARIFFYFILFVIPVHFLYATRCPKFIYLDLSQLREYGELRLGKIERLMNREMDKLVFMSRVIQVFGLLFNGYNYHTTNIFHTSCYGYHNETDVTACFFRKAVGCLENEYKQESSYYRTWNNPCNPYNQNRTHASDGVVWKPVHIENLDNETMSALFNLAACVYLRINLTRSCPQPCMTGELCRREDEQFRVNSLRCWHAQDDWNLLMQQVIAKRFDANVRAFSYICDCTSHFKWDNESLSCQVRGQECDEFTKSPCHAENTISCDSKTVKKDSKISEVICTCKEGYYGEYCEFQINACTQAIVGLKASAVEHVSDKKHKSHHVTRVVAISSKRTYYTGNELCNVNMSGEAINTTEHSMCYPELGTRYYQCKCVFPFQEDLALGTSNCIIKRTICDRHLCLHGTCAQSPDEQSEAICLCDSDWEGEQCDSPADQWGPWSDCQPMCGLNRKRFRWREALMGDKENFYQRIMQTESCSDRVANACPTSKYTRKNTSPYLTGKLKFVEQILLSVCIGLAGFGLLLFVYINVRIPDIEPPEKEEEEEATMDKI